MKKWERHRQACPPVGRQVSKTVRSKVFTTSLPMPGFIQGTEKVSLGKLFKKASLANTFLGLGRFISMRGRS
jgi:hypothetical protein